MMNRLVAASICFSFLSASVFAKEIAVMIDLNGKGGICSYRIDYTSLGNFRDKGTTSKKTSDVSCIMTAAIVDSTKASARLDSIRIKSTLYNAARIEEIKEKLLKTDFSIRLEKGSPTIDTSSKIPAADYIEWDLYRQLVKLLPKLPEKPIKPGYTWEDVGVVPIQTAAGKISCELYRFYTFKKINGDTATIVWNFRFAPADNAADKTNALEAVPIGGKGSGSAVIDVRKKRLVSADMGFSTPVAKINETSVTWQERAVFSLKGCK